MPSNVKEKHVNPALSKSVIPARFITVRLGPVASVAASAVEGTVQATTVSPVAGEIRRVIFNCTAIGSGGTHSATIYRGANEALTANSTLTTANTPVTNSTFVAAEKAVAAGDIITLRAVTPASTGSYTNLEAIAVIRLTGKESVDLN